MENRIAGVWVKYSEDDKKTWPPANKNVFIKAHYKRDIVIGIGYLSEYQAPHLESGMKIYGNSKLTENPKYIEWLDEQPIPVNQDDYWKKRCEAAENYLHNYHLWLAYVETDKEGDERTKAFKNYHKYFKEWQQLKSNPSPIPVQEGLREEIERLEKLVEKAFKYGQGVHHLRYPEHSWVYFKEQNNFWPEPESPVHPEKKEK